MGVIGATSRLGRGAGHEWSVEEHGWAEREQLQVTAGQRLWCGALRDWQGWSVGGCWTTGKRKVLVAVGREGWSETTGVIRATGRLGRGKGRDWSVEEDGWAEREQLLVTAAGQRGWAEKKGTAEHDCAGEVTTEKARVVVGGLGRTSRDWAGVFVVGQRAVCDRNGNGWKVDRNSR
ncbi:hypothetical protein ACFE04_012020 [Oxalis oulophora]